MPTATNLRGIYLVAGSAGDEADLNATILRFALLVNDASGQISGQAQIQEQGVVGPNSETNIGNVTGHIQALDFGSITKLVALKGEAVVTLPPPVVLSIVQPFQAHFAIDDAWEGIGSWTLGSQTVSNVPVRAAVLAGSEV